MAFSNHRASFLWFVALALTILAPRSLRAAPNESPQSNQITSNLSQRAATIYTNTHEQWLKELQNPRLAWEFSRACFDLAEYAISNTRRAELANQGIAAAEQSLHLDTNSAPAHYYLGMNLGQLARTKGIGALRLVHRMKNAFLASRALDQKLDYAGSDRNLGLLFRDAPSIGSVGNRKEARRCLERSVELAPEYPENRLALIEGLVKWKDDDHARQQMRLVENNWAAARAKFSGPDWEGSWIAWERMKRDLKNKLAERK